MRKDLPVEELEQMASIEIGEALRRTRMHYGKSILDIEKALRIRASQIDAIECGDVARLPGRVYAIGFVRSYAEYLGLDGAQVVKLFKAQYMDGPDKQALSFPMRVSETKTPAIWLLVFCLIGASVIIAYFKSLSVVDRTQVLRVDSVPEALKKRVEQDIMAPVLEDPVPPRDALLEDPSRAEDPDLQSDLDGRVGEQPEVSFPSDQIVLRFTGSSWTEIKGRDGTVLVSQIFEEGDSYVVPDMVGLLLTIGNDAHVKIFVKGRALKPFGNGGEVRRSIPLNLNYLQGLEFEDEKVNIEPPNIP